MKRIGLLSDTHAYWDDRYLTYFEECDEIWHAGDIGSLEVAQRLQEFRPLRAVCGNCDGGDLRRLYPELLRWTCEGADVLMTHIGGYPGRYDPRIRQQLYARPPRRRRSLPARMNTSALELSIRRENTRSPYTAMRSAWERLVAITVCLRRTSRSLSSEKRYSRVTP